MAEFKRIRFRAVLESDVMLLADSEVDRTLDGISGKLGATGLKLVSLEPEEIVTEAAAVQVSYND